MTKHRRRLVSLFAFTLVTFVFHRVQAQDSLLLNSLWESGKTYTYWVHQAEDVEGVRLNSTEYRVSLSIRHANANSVYFDAYLNYKPDSNAGRHWLLFFDGIKSIPFRYHGYTATDSPFYNPASLHPETSGNLKKLVLGLIERHYLGPEESGPLYDYIRGGSLRGNSPPPLASFFDKVNLLFEEQLHYLKTESIRFEETAPCLPDTLLLWKGSRLLRTRDQDLALTETRLLALNGEATVTRYQDCFRSGLLPGIDPEVLPGSYLYSIEVFRSFEKESLIPIYHSVRRKTAMNYNGYRTDHEWYVHVRLLEQ